MTGMIVAAIDRPLRAPIGAWASEFIKSPGFAGICALIAASLALWGILNQVTVAKRNLEHQREANDSHAWWARFEWAATRAVPVSKDETPLPYNAVLSTLTGLTESATDDVQRGAVGAISQVAAAQQDDTHGADDLPADPSRAMEESRISLLQKYADVAGDTPARSTAIEGQLYELLVIQALKRVLPPHSVSTETFRGASGARLIRPDAVVIHKGKRIIVEVKSYRRQQRLSPSATAQIRSLVETSGAEAAIVIAPIELQLDPVSQSEGSITASVWTSPNDDDNLRAALEQATS
ncbi:hypothetical protein CLV85_1148 [Salinibacterium amurskyense]|uniref:Restriction endonuclease n=2 Tax=Salinibacterium amurskyense TaxID=205941 RepID=A0A2M9D8Z9_9MICO|nr:hypothetical protein CLV85_1148 [Salinibacterium amurskyense]GHD78662.1 hypothetical protein GCM10007394_06720 [Salinibacterium amurskyense]